MNNTRIIFLLFIVLYFIRCSTNENSKVLRTNSAMEISEIDSLIKRAKPYFSYEDSLQKAIDIYEEALEKSHKIQYTKGVLISSNNLGYAYTGQSNLAKATGHFYIGLKNAEILEDSVEMSSSLFGLGLVMYNMNNWDDAIHYFSKVLTFVQSRENNSKVSGTKYLLGLCYTETNQTSLAELCFLESLEIAKTGKDHQRCVEIRLALNNLKNNEVSNAEVLLEYENLYESFKENNTTVGIAYALNGMAKYHLNQKKYDEAVVYANKSLEEAKKLSVIYPLQSILKTVTKAEFLNNNYQSAFLHNLELQKVNDSIQGIKASAQVTLMRADYDFDKSRNEYKAEISQQNKQRMVLTAVVLFLALIVLSIFYLLRKVSKERKKSEKLLLNILPLKTAQELKLYGKAKAKTHQEVAIVFADIKGFTRISSELSADVVVEMLDVYFSAFDHIVEEFKLEKIKTIGDAYMFAGGLDDPQGCVENAVNASLKMLQTVEKIEADMMQKFGTCFSFRFGMHVGEVVSGVVGEKKYAFDIWGDAVNIAARMEENSETGKLNVTEKTYSIVKDLYQFEARGAIEAKNRGKIFMYFLSNLDPISS